MTPQEVKIPDWYEDSNISSSFRYQSFQKFHKNGSQFLIQKLRDYLKAIYSHQEVLLQSAYGAQAIIFIPDTRDDVDTNLRNIILHHRKEVSFLIGYSRDIFQKTSLPK